MVEFKLFCLQNFSFFGLVLVFKTFSTFGYFFNGWLIKFFFVSLSFMYINFTCRAF